jgi:hypothetical protein
MVTVEFITDTSLAKTLLEMAISDNKVDFLKNPYGIVNVQMGFP